MDPTRVLFLGGTGVISSACVAQAVERGWDVTVLNRGTTSVRPLPDGVGVVHADVHDPARRELGPGRSGLRRGGRLPDVHPGPVASAPRAVHRPRRPVRVHQLGLGLPDAAGPPPGAGIEPAAQPVLAVLPGQDRVRGPTGRRPIATAGSRRRSCARRTPTTAPSSRSTAGGPSWTGCAVAPRSWCTVTARRCGRSPTTPISPGRSSACSAIRRASATRSTSPRTRR